MGTGRHQNLGGCCGFPEFLGMGARPARRGGTKNSLPDSPHLPRSPADAPVSPELTLVRVTPSPFFIFSFLAIVCVRSGFHSWEHKAPALSTLPPCGGLLVPIPGGGF